MKRLFLLLLSLVATGTMLADDITPEQALQIARRFADAPSTRKLTPRRAPATALSPTIAYTMRSSLAEQANVYIINLGDDHGFVIVSGESGTETNVLGYCDHGSFSPDDCPVQLRDLLGCYSAQIDTLRLRPAYSTKRVAAKQAPSLPSYMGDIVVGPLLKTTWNQNAPYNNMCPQMEGGTRAPTGCVPTAIAQVMYYWKWPKHGNGTVDGENYSTHVYDWDNMLENYGPHYEEGSIGIGTRADYFTDYNREQADAVAKLMADLGTVMGTKYSLNESTTYWSYEPIVNVFSYEADVVKLTSESPNKLKAALKEELDAERPVPYSGDPRGGGEGHAFVCDGYTTQDYFHFNYGWGGSYNGWYRLTSIPAFPINANIWTKFRPFDGEVATIDGIQYELRPNGTAHIKDYALGQIGKENGELVFPATVEKDGVSYKVTRIRQRAFFRKGHFTKIIMGDNIEFIDPYSFYYTNIDTLVLSDKMEVVPDDAFGNTKIRHLTIGENVKRIGKRAFYLCYLNQGIVSKSPAFEVDEQAFYGTKAVTGEWIGCITSVKKQAFSGVNFGPNPPFTNLEIIADSAFQGAGASRGSTGTSIFQIPAKVRKIAPSAFEGWLSTSVITVSEDNPYFTRWGDEYFNVYNKNGTSMVLAFSVGYTASGYPANLVKLEPGSYRSNNKSAYIPATVVEMEGAFSDCTTLRQLTCACPVPPAITEATFNAAIFNDLPILKVPEGSEELYRNAPVWCRFYVEGSLPASTATPDATLTYDMVIHRNGSGEGDVRIPVSEVRDVRLDDAGSNLIVSRTEGKDDVSTAVAQMDSITYVPSFVYESDEVFQLNDSTLTAHAQKCDVRFDATVIDDDVQLSIRNSVLTPNVMDGVVRGFSIDLNLSNGEHELTGTADISIPVSPSPEEKVCAAYYNPESGEWEPVSFSYDEQTGKAVITTSHLSSFAIFYVTNNLTYNAMLNFYGYAPTPQDIETASQVLIDIMASEDPKVEMAMQFKDEMSLWQSVGLDMLWNAVRGVGESVIDFRPEYIDNAVEVMGYLGTALNIFDVARADLNGDNKGVASGTLKTILSYSTGQMAAAIGTPIMTVSMAAVAFIGVALEKFGTMVANRKTDLFREAYRYYYSKQFSTKKKIRRSAKDWYEYFYPAFSEGKMDDYHLNAYIEQSVRSYCNQFWNSENKDDYDYCCAIKGVSMAGGTYAYPTEAMQEEISNEHFAELMHGELESVFLAIRNHIRDEAEERYRKALEDVANMVNRGIRITFVDSSCKEGEKSQYAGWTVRFSDLASNVKDTKGFQRTLSEKGGAKMGVRIYALIQNGMGTSITLVDPKGKEQKSFTFDIPDGKGYIDLTIDVTGGVKVDTNPLEGLELTYEPSKLVWGFDWGEEDYHDAGVERELELTGNIPPEPLQRARLQREIERYFNQHDFISVDKVGNLRIGDDLTAKFEGNEARGNFEINTSNNFTEQTLQQYVALFNDPKTESWKRSCWLLLGGILQHSIKGEFVVTRESAASNNYTVTYQGTGKYALLADVITKVIGDNIDWEAIYDSEEKNSATIDNITHEEKSQDGTVTLKYTTVLRQK